MGARPVANQALAAMIEQAGWTHAATAKHVNAVAAETNNPLFYDRSAVGHWLTGTVPRAEGISAAVEAFRRRLNRPDLGPAALGWPDTVITSRVDDPWQGDPVVRLAVLGEDDMLNRRTALTAGAFTLAALSGMTPRPAHAQPSVGGRAGAADVIRIRDTTRTFSRLADQYGGGHARPAVAAYLVHEVTPMLRDSTGRARPDLFRAASELSYLAGYMAMDAGAQALAQRYYISSIRLADEAGDPMLRATSLRSMAVQATELRHDREALALADAAASCLGRGGPLRTLAWVTGMQAEAQAGVGSRWESLTLLRRAEALLDRADSAPELDWTGNYRREAFEHQTGLVLTRLGEHTNAARHYAISTATRQPFERRSRALIGLRAAHAHLLAGNIEQAAAAVLDLGHSIGSISSARVRNELRRLRVGWQPYRNNAQIAAADRLAATAGRS